MRSVAHVLRERVSLALLLLLGRVPQVLARGLHRLEPHHRTRRPFRRGDPIGVSHQLHQLRPARHVELIHVHGHLVLAQLAEGGAALGGDERSERVELRRRGAALV